MKYHRRRRNNNHRRLILLVVLTFLLSLTPTVALTQDVTPTEQPTDNPPATTEAPPAQEQPTEVAPTEEQPTEAVTTEAPPTEVATTEAPPTEVVTTEAPTEEQPTEVVTTEAPTEAPTEKPTEAPTEEQPTKQTEEPVTATPEATEEAPVPGRGGRIVPALMQTFCQMDISDANDNDPFTFVFSAINANNIASFTWDLGDGTGPFGGQIVNHTYGAPNTYNIQLTCTPQPGFGANIVLNGTISIDPMPTAFFELLPGYNILRDVSVGNPLTITSVNQSLPVSGLSYQWTVRSLPSNTILYTATTENISYDITGYGNFSFELVVSINSQNSTMTRTIAVNAPAPRATFTVDPSTGPSPLNATITFVDYGDGPITSWSWDVDGDGIDDPAFDDMAVVNYSYVADGPHSIRLTYTGPGGSGTVTQQVLVLPEGGALTADFSWVSNGSVPGGVEICFTNTSIGAYTLAEWDFDGDGTYETQSMASTICHVYATEGNRQVYLQVSNIDNFSNTLRNVNIVFAPVAAFTVSPGTEINFGIQIDLDSSSSTGSITSYAWDFNGDGTTDNTQANPQDISLTQLGPNPIRLTVTGLGGSSFVEQIVMVLQLELTCDFTGSLNVLPTAGGQDYTSTVSNVNGRTLSYEWTITGTGAGLPMTFTDQDITVNWAAIGTGTFQVMLEVTANDGFSCTETKTVNVSYPALNCVAAATPALPSPLYPDGSSYTFNGSVTGLADRTLTAQNWTITGSNGFSDSGTGASINWANIIDHTTAGVNWVVRYEITASDGSSCFEEIAFSTAPYPTPSCTVAGEIVPLPDMPSSTGQYSYQANISDPAGRTITDVQWSVGANGSLISPQGSTTMTVQWASTAAYNYASTLDAVMTIQNADGSTETVNCTQLEIEVTVPRLVCNTPVGDIVPVVNETEIYTSSLFNDFGRNVLSINWELRRDAPAPGGTVVDNSQTGSTFTFQFLLPNVVYYLTYTASVDGVPSDNCLSAALEITVNDGTVNFDCDAFNNGDFTPTPPGGSYIYRVDIDNGNNILLAYTWTLFGPNGQSVVLTPTPIESSVNGLVASPAFSGDSLAPWGIGNYTLRVDVEAVNSADSTYTCSEQRGLVVGTLNVTYSYLDNGGGAINNNAVAVNTPICITNNSAATPGGFAGLTYAWTVNGTPEPTLSVTDPNAGCIAFATPGTYTIQLTGTNLDQGDAAFRRSANYSVTYRVYGLQSITISRENQIYAPSPIDFAANGINIAYGYNWSFYQVGNPTPFFTSNAQNPQNVYFATPGMYRAVVVGHGDLGDTTAMVEFELISPSDLRASFRASQYAGVAPLDVCFTDTSIGDIDTWEWDFNGDGIIDVTYDDGDPVPPLCTTYTGPGGTSYLVRLTVRNATNERTAQSTIRIYSPFETGATFRIEPQGGGGFCFYGEVTTGVTITGWSFGDGSPDGGAVNPICHNYAQAGTYRVQMYIEGPNGETGIVERPVTYDPNNNGIPVLGATGSCSAARVATFTVTNTGDDMVTNDQVIITNQSGVVVLTAPVFLQAGESATFTVSNQSGTLTLELVDAAGVTATTDCYYPPEITVSAACSAGSLPVFTVTNARPTDGPMAAPQAYTILNSNGDTVATGTFQLTLGETSEDVSVPAGSNPYDTYTFVSNGAVGDFDVDHDCADQPILAISHTCATAGISFTVENTGGSMVIDQAYTITSGVTTITTGNLNIATGASQTITIPAGNNPYAAYTLTSNGFAGDISGSMDCADPVLAVSSACAWPLTFTVENTGAQMLVAQDYTITSGATTIATGSLNIAAGASQTISLPTNIDPYAAYTLTSNGFAGDITGDLDCADPVFSVSSTCAWPLTFTVENTGGDMLTTQDYIITSGVTTIATGSLNIASGASQTISLPTNIDPYAAYVFNTTGFAGDATGDLDCADPAFVITSTCTWPMVFNVVNNGGDMLTPQAYTITSTAGTVVASGNLNLTAAASTDIQLPTNIDPYAGYTFETIGFAGDATYTQNCDRPVLVITSVCISPFSATVTNNGGDMITPENYTLTSENGQRVAQGTLDLNNGQSLALSVSTQSPYLEYIFDTNGFSDIVNNMSDCGQPRLDVNFVCSDIPTFTLTNNGDDMLFGQGVQVTNSSGTVVYTADFQLTSGETLTIPLSGGTEGERFTLSTGGFAGWIVYIGDCAGEALISVASYCEEPAAFVLTNNGQSMSAAQDYTLTDALTGTVLDAGSFQLDSGEALSISIPADSAVTFSTDGAALTLDTTFSCSYTLTALPTTLPFGQTFGGLDFDGLPDWSNVATCGYNCPIFQVYHTDEIGGWEIFRLDGADAETKTTFRQNLSLGLDPNVENLSPSLSPDNNWVIFQSNRDGNWELYVAPTSGENPDAVQRVTFNHVAIDSDPVWGPNNFVVYETTRHGNWDLYMIDMATGLEYRLTDDLSDDINPVWSDDGSRIAFQSDRVDENGDRRWQIYEINLRNRSITRLSDGTGIDVEPHYAHNGQQIAFRSYEAAGENSSLMLMDADGRNRMSISDTEGDATNAAWSPSDRYIAYQSDLDGDLDVYVYELATGNTRQISDNDIADYAPTWLCDDERVVFTSDVTDDPNIFEANVQPITDPGIKVDEDADQKTFEPSNDIYPLSSPAEEHASREGQTVLGAFGEQTIFLLPDVNVTKIDLTLDDIVRDEWEEIKACPAA